ncbi:hypothetical protein AWB91_03420 [Mycobacterium paraense]|uniref:Uncharacterized protein n=1 Tax=Mycobacterium paraense TaxID=767916 RepID=A0A1X2AF17_9MYCO|nr:hypothetical protein [Mycobacterium paraense]MCV7443994.1 hypothetical protein [Mycobacterium paraense]ORW27363.1 hypothetical protein AWB91_03420 [Mycobacterium paraense]ORW43935.1 hypothetical protein AWB88_06705 [Mycobacterium paraense]ORW47718.1 hypothetical protein AWB89_07950 [Mycobacterium paraense]ORW49957.1 hypothetical protein AWB90_08110 [Mycobacterium paraense]
MTTARAGDRVNDLAIRLDLAAPSGAIWVDEWESAGAAFRVFDGPEWRIKQIANHGRCADTGDIVVSVIGRQYADGRAEREIIIDGACTPVITAAEARMLSGALAAAADAAEG